MTESRGPRHWFRFVCPVDGIVLYVAYAAKGTSGRVGRRVDCFDGERGGLDDWLGK